MRYLILLGLAAVMALEIYHQAYPHTDRQCVSLCVSPNCVRT